MDQAENQAACEALSMAIVALLEEATDLAAARPAQGLRTYAERATVLSRHGHSISQLAGAMAVLARWPGKCGHCGA